MQIAFRWLSYKYRYRRSSATLVQPCFLLNLASTFIQPASKLENRNRNYWNKLELEISNSHTTAIVTHWTGRVVARASTQEWSIRQFLYNLTDGAALKVVGQVISQRCLETGVSEVYLDVSEEDREKEKMVRFIDVIEQSGLSLSEPNIYMPTNPHIATHRKIQPKRVKPWTVLEPED